jgi:hypothetical protein
MIYVQCHNVHRIVHHKIAVQNFYPFNNHRV